MTPDGLITSEFDDAAVIDAHDHAHADAVNAGPRGGVAGAGFRSLEDDLFDTLEPADFFDPYDRWEDAVAVTSGRRGRR
jgi:hypothetical protein